MSWWTTALDIAVTVGPLAFGVMTGGAGLVVGVGLRLAVGTAARIAVRHSIGTAIKAGVVGGAAALLASLSLGSGGGDSIGVTREATSESPTALEVPADDVFLGYGLNEDSTKQGEFCLLLDHEVIWTAGNIEEMVAGHLAAIADGSAAVRVVFSTSGSNIAASHLIANVVGSLRQRAEFNEIEFLGRDLGVGTCGAATGAEE